MRMERLISRVLTIVLLAAGVAIADGPPRSARLVKDAGNQFLAAKKYADAIDCYFQALEIYPDFPDAHYNLGVSFLKGYKMLPLALYHFDTYLQMSPNAADRENVQALVEALTARVQPPPKDRAQVVSTVAGRLLVSGGDWAKKGDRIEFAEKGQDPCACLLAEFIYPDYALTQRIWDETTLERVKPGLVAVNLSEQGIQR